MTYETNWHLPTRPYGIIDAMNRRAAAVGSPGYAQATAGADYNGHHVWVAFNDYRGYWVAEYQWAGRVVLSRGTFPDCLRAAVAEYDRGALGSDLAVGLRPGGDAELAEICCGSGLLPGRQAYPLEWWTWRHAAAVSSVRDAANPRALRRWFDYELLQASETLEDYDAALAAKHGSAWAC